jgi:CheY-like chemotaxis protein
MEIRRHEGDSRHNPIIAMTAHAQKSDRERCLSQGMDDYMAKPVELAIVARVLTRWAPLPTTPPIAASAALEAEGGTAERVLDPRALTQILKLGEPGEPSLLEQMIAAFRTSSAGYVASLRAAIEVDDHETVSNVAHALKGAGRPRGRRGVVPTECLPAGEADPA